MTYLTYNQYDFDFVFSAEGEGGGGGEKTTNQNTVPSIYSVLIGRFQRTSTNSRNIYDANAR